MSPAQRSLDIGPRNLLKRLRAMMAAPESEQDKLDKIVMLIAANMVAEVCSIYVLCPDGQLELFATKGLKQSAVHNIRMPIGKGLVGLIAEKATTLSIQNAAKHPSFEYFPESGEEIYNTFLGTPILRAGQTLGVITVQNRVNRIYSEDETEALEIVAMLLAEQLSQAGFKKIATPDAGLATQQAKHYTGISICEGIGLGHVVLHEPRLVIQNLLSDDPERERARLSDAVQNVQRSIDKLLNRRDISRGGEHKEILETFRMFASDTSWIGRIQEVIEKGLSAEAAVEREQSNLRARFLRAMDPLIRERLHDIEDLTYRVLCELLGHKPTASQTDLPDNTILVARHMGPAALLDYKSEKLRGLVLEEGTPSSHVAIIARALGIPAISQVAEITSLVELGDSIIIDAIHANVFLRPTPEIEAGYAEKVRFRARRQAQYDSLRNAPAITKDGREIKIFQNAGLLVDMPNLQISGAEGIGLFRTELQFMISGSMPKESHQIAFYQSVLQAAGDKPVVFRSLDIGGDKPLPYLRFGHEENPAMGWRAIRFTLDRPAILRTQIRALLLASQGHELHLMFPMISDVNEFDRAKQYVEREKRYLKRSGHTLPKAVKLGTMIEVPALLWQLDELCQKVDFVSLGTNDLMQFIYAADRGNARLQGRYPNLSPVTCRIISDIVKATEHHNIPFTICGELAGQPFEAIALIGLGVKRLSMSPANVGPLKSMILSLDYQKTRDFMNDAMNTPNAHILRKKMTNFITEHAINLP